MSAYVYVYRYICNSMPVYECMCLHHNIREVFCCLIVYFYPDFLSWYFMEIFFYRLYIPVWDVPNKTEMVLQQREQHSMTFMSNKANLHGMIIFAAQ